jgi:hypothetical protein
MQLWFCYVGVIYFGTERRELHIRQIHSRVYFILLHSLVSHAKGICRKRPTFRLSSSLVTTTLSSEMTGQHYLRSRAKKSRRAGVASAIQHATLTVIVNGAEK